MIEKRIVDRKTGQRIQARADDSIVASGGIPLQIGIRAQPRHAELEHEHRHHGKRHPCLRQQRRQPEKRRTVQIERIRVHRRGTEVRLPAPLARAVFHEPVHVSVERDLLAVEIAAVLEQALVHDEERQKDEKRRRGAHAERQQIPVHLLFLFLLCKATHNLLLLL